MMKCQSPFSSQYRFLRLLRHVVAEVEQYEVFSDSAWQRQRLLGTAAARETPAANRGKGKKLSKELRKAIVVEYVNKYRIMNGGKFPSAQNIRDQAGGCYYVVRSILQELKHNSQQPTVIATDKTSKVGKTTKFTRISEEREAVDNVAPPHMDNGHPILGEDGSSIHNVISAVDKVFDHEELGMGLVHEFSNRAEESSKRSVEMSESRFQRTIPNVETTSSNSINQPTDKDGVREALDGEVEIGTATITKDHGLSVKCDSMKQGEVSSHFCQTMVDPSVMTDDQETVVEDSSASATSVNLKFKKEQEQMSTANVDIGGDIKFMDSTEVSVTENMDETMVDPGEKSAAMVYEISSKSDHSESLSSCRSTKLPEVDVVSSTDIESHQFKRYDMEKTEEKPSLWGNLKSFASSFLSIWRKS